MAVQAALLQVCLVLLLPLACLYDVQSCGPLRACAGFYTGNEEVFLPSNVLFRMGGAACLMSTR